MSGSHHLLANHLSIKELDDLASQQNVFYFLCGKSEGNLT